MKTRAVVHAIRATKLTQMSLDSRPMGSDFALERVPKSMRYSWVSMAVEQVAQGGCIAVVVIGAQLGHKMTGRDAFLAVIFGNLILAVTLICPTI